MRGRFEEFPMPHPFRELVGMIPAESPRRRPAKIEIPEVVTEREYDLVCIGSPTWWLSTDVPVRSFLESDTASRALKGKPLAVAVCRRYWKHNLKTVRRLGAKHGGRLGRVPRALSRSRDPADQLPGLPPGGGTDIRGSGWQIAWQALAYRTSRKELR